MRRGRMRTHTHSTYTDFHAQTGNLHPPIQVQKPVHAVVTSYEHLPAPKLGATRIGTCPMSLGLRVAGLPRISSPLILFS